MKASALALRKTPRLNGLFLDGEFKPGEGIHIGWAVSLRGGGLIAPAIRDADRKSLSEIMTALRDVVERARKGSLRSSELGSATVTGTAWANAARKRWRPSSIRLKSRSLASADRLAALGRGWSDRARSVVAATLAGDHRVTDGHMGGLLLTNIRDLLQEPDETIDPERNQSSSIELIGEIAPEADTTGLSETRICARRLTRLDGLQQSDHRDS